MQDRNVKITKEEGSRSKMDTTDDRFEISYRKKPKLNPVTEQEETNEIVEIIDTDTMVEKSKGPVFLEEAHQPSTSNTQIIEK